MLPFSPSWRLEWVLRPNETGEGAFLGLQRLLLSLAEGTGEAATTPPPCSPLTFSLHETGHSVWKCTRFLVAVTKRLRQASHRKTDAIAHLHVESKEQNKQTNIIDPEAWMHGTD